MNGLQMQASASMSVMTHEHINKYTLIWEAMPGLAMTSFKECLYAEDAPDNKTFCLLSMSALQQVRATSLCKLSLNVHFSDSQHILCCGRA